MRTHNTQCKTVERGSPPCWIFTKPFLSQFEKRLMHGIRSHFIPAPLNKQVYGGEKAVDLKKSVLCPYSLRELFLILQINVLIS